MELIKLTSKKAESSPNAPRRPGGDSCKRSKDGTREGGPLPVAEGIYGASVPELLRRAVGAGLLIAASAIVNAADARVSDMPNADWQIARLMAPTASQLSSESRGQVFIYDSLDINQVEKAMDANFDRIQHMMFTRVRHPAPTPNSPAYLEDDGCD
jgi:hypothetical protein